MSGSFVAAFLSLCMVFVVVSIVTSGAGSSAGNWISSALWGCGAFAFASICPWLWRMGRAMTGYRVVLGTRGVDFNLGTKKKPSDLFLSWEQIAAIKQQRAGAAQRYFVFGRDGSRAIFSSYTFFRSGKIAHLIAEHTGLAIQKS
jgi:hypothetical protein